MFEGLGIAYEAQRTLSKAQTIPLFGPALVSPVKAFCSLVETIAALAVTILFGTLTFITENPTIFLITTNAVLHAGLGLFGLGYSIANIVTLGLVGLSFEYGMDKDFAYF